MPTTRVNVTYSDREDPLHAPQRKFGPCSYPSAERELKKQGYEQGVPKSGIWFKSESTSGGASHIIGYARVALHIKSEPLKNLP